MMTLGQVTPAEKRRHLVSVTHAQRGTPAKAGGPGRGGGRAYDPVLPGTSHPLIPQRQPLTMNECVQQLAPFMNIKEAEKRCVQQLEHGNGKPPDNGEDEEGEGKHWMYIAAAIGGFILLWSLS